MKTVLIILAEGFEEMEAVVTIGILRRAGCKVLVAALHNKTVISARKIKIQADRRGKQRGCVQRHCVASDGTAKIAAPRSPARNQKFYFRTYSGISDLFGPTGSRGFIFVWGNFIFPALFIFPRDLFLPNRMVRGFLCCGIWGTRNKLEMVRVCRSVAASSIRICRIFFPFSWVPGG